MLAVHIALPAAGLQVRQARAWRAVHGKLHVQGKILVRIDDQAQRTDAVVIEARGKARGSAGELVAPGHGVFGFQAPV